MFKAFKQGLTCFQFSAILGTHQVKIIFFSIYQLQNEKYTLTWKGWGQMSYTIIANFMVSSCHLPIQLVKHRKSSLIL
jgi:hypothetical protein